MKQKMIVSKKTQKIANLILWVIMFSVLFAFSPEVRAEKQPVNKEVRKYHRQAKKNFHCSLCPAKGLRKFIPKRWR